MSPRIKLIHPHADCVICSPCPSGRANVKRLHGILPQLAVTSCLTMSALFSSPAQAAFLDIGSQVDTYTGESRGYFFTAPTDFVITGLRVPTDASTDTQYIQAVKFNSGVPPEYPDDTTNFTTLGTWTGLGTNFFDTNIPVSSGDVIGILGVRGQTNSYGSVAFGSSILGEPVTLYRLVYQDALSNGPAGPVSAEDWLFGRVEMRYEPVPGPLPVLGTLAAFGYSRKLRKRIGLASKPGVSPFR
jgi:hypothetical protein